MRLDLSAFVLLPVFVGPAMAQDGATPFRAAQVTGHGLHRYDLTLDLDLDGDPDYLGGWDTRILWHENLGDGRVAMSHHLLTSGDAPWANYCRSDLDNDGHPDAVCFAGTEALAILARPGGPVVHSTPIADHATTPFVADLQGDGDPEIVVAAYGAGARIQAYDYDPRTNTFVRVLAHFTLHSDFVVVDTDGDGADEICPFNDNWIWVWGINPDWTVTQINSLANPFGGDFMWVVGDVDGDADTDLVLFQDGVPGSANYAMFRREPGGQLVQQATVVGGPATDLGDIDGDGDLDGLCCGGGSGPYPNTVTSDFMVSFNDGTGRFAPARAIRGIGARQLAGCVDVDGDGDNDLVAGRAVVFNPGNITEVFPAAGGYAARHENLSDADRDLDADLDFVGGGSFFSWYEAKGDGTFVRNTSPIANPSAHLAATGLTGDFDGDGDVDGLLEDRSTTPVQVRLYRNRGGSFGTPIDAAPPGLSMLPTSTYHGGNGVSWENHWRFADDWDRDGDVDCVVVDESRGGTTLLFENDGTGYFTPGPALPSGTLVLGVGDLTGDGIADLLSGSYLDLDLLFYLPGTGSGFGPAVLLGTVFERDERPGIVDIDGDGDLDVLSSTQSGGILLRNLGNGRFHGEPTAFASYRLAWWSFADVDGNGTLDAISHQPYFDSGRTSSIVLQRQDGTFAPPVVLVAAVAAAVDADWDGDLDLVGDETVFNRTAAGSFGAIRQIGNGVRGTGAVRPRLNNIGILAPGNAVTARISGVRGAAPGIYVLGLGERSIFNSPLPGLTLYVGQLFAPLPIVVDGTPGAAGAGSWRLDWVVPAGLGGLGLYSQAFFLDEASTAAGWSQTNGKRVVLPN